MIASIMVTVGMSITLWSLISLRLHYSVRGRANRARRQRERDRSNAEFRASNGEHLPRQEREALDLPDWTG
jgi:hypothetical protein